MRLFLKRLCDRTLQLRRWLDGKEDGRDKLHAARERAELVGATCYVVANGRPGLALRDAPAEDGRIEPQLILPSGALLLAPVRSVRFREGGAENSERIVARCSCSIALPTQPPRDSHGRRTAAEARAARRRACPRLPRGRHRARAAVKGATIRQTLGGETNEFRVHVNPHGPRRLVNELGIHATHLRRCKWSVRVCSPLTIRCAAPQAVIEKRVLAIYEDKNPAALGDVPKLMAKHKGAFHKML